MPECGDRLKMGRKRRPFWRAIPKVVLFVAVFHALQSHSFQSQDSSRRRNIRHTNRLIHEKSPYLLQHAHNPVDWYPWGREAFDKALRENKPVFLSVGYSTCHWCHVMERE